MVEEAHLGFAPPLLGGVQLRLVGEQEALVVFPGAGGGAGVALRAAQLVVDALPLPLPSDRVVAAQLAHLFVKGPQVELLEAQAGHLLDRLLGLRHVLVETGEEVHLLLAPPARPHRPRADRPPPHRQPPTLFQSQSLHLQQIQISSLSKMH